MKIGVMNATKLSIDPVDMAAKELPELEIYHFMDEGMSWLGKTEGRISGRNLARMVNLIHSAEELGMDGILLSCTIFSPYIDLLRPYTDLPMVAADIGVFEYAAAHYPRIGAVVSFAPTMDSVAWVVQRCRERVNPAFEAELRLASGAFEAAAAGDVETHNRLLYEAACALVPGKDAIVLSQMSHVRALPLFSGFPIPVLTSPSVSLKLLAEMIAKNA